MQEYKLGCSSRAWERWYYRRIYFGVYCTVEADIRVHGIVGAEIEVHCIVKTEFRA